jgi:hypothetical protein
MIINYDFGFIEQARILPRSFLAFFFLFFFYFFYDATRHRAVALRSFLAFLL